MAAELPRIQQTAAAVAALDMLCSLATVALNNNYCCPTVDLSDEIVISEGRHPVVEQLLDGAPFVPNDTRLNNRENQIAVLTGPNMAGKSTYMRQVALIVLMAQMGSFVPAKYAHIGVVDRIFTRIGASDDLAAGQSTFMVEMTEVAEILKNATAKSLVVLDEIGRGTSTFDGMSIARAVVEHISDPAKGLGCKTLFATHYHELNEMEHSYPKIKNFNVSVKEVNNKVVFLRKLVKGGSNHSFGIQVGKMAGLPQSVIKRSSEILKQLENDRNSSGAIQKNVAKIGNEREGIQLSFFQLEDPVLLQIRDEIAGLDINSLTPLEALNKLNEIKKITGI